jgi:hypothetical protein
MPTTTVKVAGNGGREVKVMFSHVKDAVAKADIRPKRNLKTPIKTPGTTIGDCQSERGQ